MRLHILIDTQDSFNQVELSRSDLNLDVLTAKQALSNYFINFNARVYLTFAYTKAMSCQQTQLYFSLCIECSINSTTLVTQIWLN